MALVSSASEAECRSTVKAYLPVFRIAHVGQEGNKLVAEKTGKSLDFTDALLDLLARGRGPRGAKDGMDIDVAEGAKKVGA